MAGTIWRSSVAIGFAGAAIVADWDRALARSGSATHRKLVRSLAI
jgi:hypothetical protein